TTENSEFVNLANNPGSFAVDGLATLTPGATAGDGSMLTFSVQLTGATPTLDMSLLQQNTTADYIAGLPPPAAPVVGGLTSAGEFQAAAGQDSLTPTQNIDVTQSKVAFGWTGTNDDPNTVSWISGYTNKTFGQDLAVIEFSPSLDGTATYLPPVVAHA